MIRAAVIADVPRLVEMGVLFLASTAYGAVLPTNRAAIAERMAWLIEHPDRDVLVTVDHADTPTGMLGVLAFAHPLSGQWVAGHLFWWQGPRLLRAGEQWARAHGAESFLMNAPMMSATVDVARHYVQRGYRAVETSYLLDLRGAA